MSGTGMAGTQGPVGLHGVFVALDEEPYGLAAVVNYMTGHGDKCPGEIIACDDPRNNVIGWTCFSCEKRWELRIPNVMKDPLVPHFGSALARKLIIGNRYAALLVDERTV